MTVLDLGADLDLTREAALAAGALARSHFGAGRRSWYKGPGQVVTDADLEVDALLHDMLRGARPDYGWLSEERVDDRSRTRCARTWVVDPIDGTRAFADGRAAVRGQRRPGRARRAAAGRGPQPGDG